MKHFQTSVRRCLSLCFFGLLPFTSKAKPIEITFDAKAYTEAKDWRNFIAELCKTLKEAPNYENGDTFHLRIENGTIFGTVPAEPNDGNGKEPTDTAKILSDVSTLTVETEHFSTASLRNVFQRTKSLYLPNTEYISGISQKIGLRIGSKDFQTLSNMPKPIASEDCIEPDLQSVYAPNVTEIANAAFFRFEELQHFNDLERLPGEERPTFVCTPLEADYFAAKQAPKHTDISPIVITTKQKSNGKTVKEYGGKSVKIGACAFLGCRRLQHVSAHASFIGSAAFSASGIKSAHLLLTASVQIGDDVFFNCFSLKECFILLDRTEAGRIGSCLNGFFWNCFALETVCMPNITFSFSKRRKIRNTLTPKDYQKRSLTVFTNCFSLKELDVRSFSRDYGKILPYWLTQSNLRLLSGKGTENAKKYRSAALAADYVPENIADSEKIREYIRLCSRPTRKPVNLFQHKAPGESIYGKPYCDLTLLAGPGDKLQQIKSHLNRSAIETVIETDPFSFDPEKPFLDLFALQGRKAFFRFNDACMRWFSFMTEKNGQSTTEQK